MKNIRNVVASILLLIFPICTIPQPVFAQTTVESTNANAQRTSGNAYTTWYTFTSSGDSFGFYVPATKTKTAVIDSIIVTCTGTADCWFNVYQWYKNIPTVTACGGTGNGLSYPLNSYQFKQNYLNYSSAMQSVYNNAANCTPPPSAALITPNFNVSANTTYKLNIPFTLPPNSGMHVQAGYGAGSSVYVMAVWHEN